MPNPIKNLTVSLLIAAGLIGGKSYASEDERWFRVELLVFANNTAPSPGAALTPEQWDATPDLTYPTATRFLIDPERVASNASEFEGDSVLDEYGRQIITPPSDEEVTNELDSTLIDAADEPSALEAPEEAVADLTPAPVRPTPVYQGEIPEGAILPDAASPVPTELRLPEPFVLLPADYLEFGERANRMRNGGDYTVLFHQSWVQPVTGSSTSLPIVLDHSGDELFWPPLQGTIDIHLARYLEVKTHLWLNTSGDYLPGAWQMPAPPLGPPSLIVEEEELIDIAGVISELPDASLSSAEDAIESPESDSGGEALSANDLGLESSVTIESPGAADEVLDPNNPASATQQETGPVYPYRHAVLLEQTRRMRSNEVHYIDHPVLGVVVKFTPLDPEELDTIAESQPPLDMVGQLE
ncbi:MAG: CsiV family protein [Pseudomonadota bacterium]